MYLVALTVDLRLCSHVISLSGSESPVLVPLFHIFLSQVRVFLLSQALFSRPEDLARSRSSQLTTTSGFSVIGCLDSFCAYKYAGHDRIIGLVTLSAVYHYIRIFSSWMDGPLLQFKHVGHDRPHHWLGHAHRSLPLHQNL